jgi:hypothetical protein
LGNLLCEVQAQPNAIRPLRLRKPVKQARQEIGLDTGAFVAHGDHRPFLAIAQFGGGPERNSNAVRRVLLCIRQQVVERLT